MQFVRQHIAQIRGVVAHAGNGHLEHAHFRRRKRLRALQRVLRDDDKAADVLARLALARIRAAHHVKLTVRALLTLLVFHLIRGGHVGVGVLIVKVAISVAVRRGGAVGVKPLAVVRVLVDGGDDDAAQHPALNGIPIHAEHAAPRADHGHAAQRLFRLGLALCGLGHLAFPRHKRRRLCCRSGCGLLFRSHIANLYNMARWKRPRAEAGFKSQSSQRVKWATPRPSRG